MKANNIWTFPNRKNNMGNHFQLSSQELHLEPIKIGKRLYVSSLKQVHFSLTNISQNVSDSVFTVYRGKNHLQKTPRLKAQTF